MHVLVQPVHPVLVLQVMAHSTVTAPERAQPCPCHLPWAGSPGPAQAVPVPAVSRSGCWPGSGSSCSRR